MSSEQEQAGGLVKALSLYTEGCRSITVNMSRGELFNLLADEETENHSEDKGEGVYTGSITELFAGRPDSPAVVMSSAGMTDERMARHFGIIGRNLDKAKSEGKFSDDEYKALCESLDEYMEHIILRNEQTRATRAVMQQEWKDRMAGGGKDQLSLEELEEKRSHSIVTYLTEHGIDREALRKMAEDVRKGE